jgi:hypothetical protein
MVLTAARIRDLWKDDDIRLQSSEMEAMVPGSDLAGPLRPLAEAVRAYAARLDQVSEIVDRLPAENQLSLPIDRYLRMAVLDRFLQFGAARKALRNAILRALRAALEAMARLSSPVTDNTGGD